MDLKALEKMWDQQTVTGAPPPADVLIVGLKREVRHVRRRIRGGIVLVAAVLALGWTLMAVAYLTGLKRVAPIDLIAETTGFVLYVAFFVRAVRSARVVREAEAALGGTLRESLDATLRTVNVQIENARLAVIVIPAVVAISGVLFTAKCLNGNIPRVGAISGTAFIAVLGAAIGAAFWHRYRTRLLPQRDELSAALRSLEDTSP